MVATKHAGPGTSGGSSSVFSRPVHGVGVVFVALVLVSCTVDDPGEVPAGAEAIEFSGKHYATVDSVMSDSEGSIRVEILREVGREQDGGGNEGIEGYHAGLPMVVFEARIVDLYGSRNPGTTFVTYLDAEAGNFTGGGDGGLMEPLEVGDDIILSYRQLKASEMPGISLVDSTLVPTGGEDGVMDVLDDVTVVPRSPSILALGDQAPLSSSAPAGGHTVTFPLSDVDRLASVFNTEERGASGDG